MDSGGAVAALWKLLWFSALHADLRVATRLATDMHGLCASQFRGVTDIARHLRERVQLATGIARHMCESVQLATGIARLLQKPQADSKELTQFVA